MVLVVCGSFGIEVNLRCSGGVNVLKNEHTKPHQKTSKRLHHHQPTFTSSSLKATSCLADTMKEGRHSTLEGSKSRRNTWSFLPEASRRLDRTSIMSKACVERLIADGLKKKEVCRVQDGSKWVRGVRMSNEKVGVKMY